MAGEIGGMIELRTNLAKVGPEMLRRLGDAMYQEMLISEGRIKRERVPVDLGTLRDTIETGQPEYGDNEVSVTIRAGGPAAPYALAVHEHLSEHSPPSWRKAEETGRGVHFAVGGPKYLEAELNERAATIVQDVAARMEE